MNKSAIFQDIHSINVVEVSAKTLIPIRNETMRKRAIAADGEPGSLDGTVLWWRVEL